MWKKAKIFAECVGLIIIPIIILLITQNYSEAETAKATADRQAETDKVLSAQKTETDKAIGIQYVKIAIDILQQKPDKETTEFRNWAIDTFTKYSEVKPTKTFIEELRKKPLLKSASFTMSGGAVATGNAKFEFYQEKPTTVSH